jgi:hypothetical protein
VLLSEVLESAAGGHSTCSVVVTGERKEGKFGRVAKKIVCT